jgi:hypothetical protein
LGWSDKVANKEQGYCHAYYKRLVLFVFLSLYNLAQNKGGGEVATEIRQVWSFAVTPLA